MHRAAVDNNFPGIDAMGLFVADIVPIVAEYAAFSNPNASIGYFHWSFLPKGTFFMQHVWYGMLTVKQASSQQT